MSSVAKPSPPKPWERNAAQTGSSHPVVSASSNGTNATSTTSGSCPALPPRPADMTSAVATTTAAANTATAQSAYSANNYASRMGTTYGGYGSGYGSTYGSPYSRFGAGGYGGYGGGFGSYGSGYGGFGAPFGGYPGQGGPADYSLTRQMEAGTAATFQLLQSVVSAFGGFAQMLESTFMATHSSFFAMIGVAEQLGNLRNWLGEILNVFTLLRWVKRMLGMGGNDVQAVAGASADGALSAESFRAFESNGGVVPQNQKASTPKPSKKPLIIFFLTVVGLPWLMNKLVRLITARQEAEARRLGLPEGAIVPIFGQDGQPLPQHMQPPGVDLSLLPSNQPQAVQDPPLDPSKLTFVRAVHSYQSLADDGFELSFEKNDIIAVLTPKEERQEPGWWRGRLRNGKIGWFPSTHVQEVPMKDGSNAAKVSDGK